MMRRRAMPALLSTVGATNAVRAAHFPGWKNSTSTRDGRSREKREQDRKQRQIDKLPHCQALHDYQYPYDKTVMSDHQMQQPVFSMPLDTPHLFHMAPPEEFIAYWNVSDFERSSFPAIPDRDHRLLSADSAEFKTQHRPTLRNFLHKHEITPDLIPQVACSANLSVVFGDQPKAMDLDNFWLTAHGGNFIPLKDLQKAPSVFVAVPEADKSAFYTLVIASPDFPYRTKPNDGFFVNTIVSNISGASLDATQSEAASLVGDRAAATRTGKGAASIEASLSETDRVSYSKKMLGGGDVVVPWVPPLPTEDAGCTRHLCMLFKQDGGKIEGLTAANGENAFSFAERSDFRLHSKASEARAERFPSLVKVESKLPVDPAAVTFFQTNWDIQVQEFYEKIGQPEPAYVHDMADDDLESFLQFEAMDPSQFRPRGRQLADGSVNHDGRVQLQVHDSRVTQGTAQHYFSTRSMLGKNGKRVVVPK